GLHCPGNAELAHPENYEQAKPQVNCNCPPLQVGRSFDLEEYCCQVVQLAKGTVAHPVQSLANCRNVRCCNKEAELAGRQVCVLGCVGPLVADRLVVEAEELVGECLVFGPVEVEYREFNAHAVSLPGNLDAQLAVDNCVQEYWRAADTYLGYDWLRLIAVAFDYVR